MVDGVQTLRYLADQACLELHRWLSRTDRIDNPDLLVLDLDPPPWPDLRALRRTAREAVELFEAVGLQPHLMATGSAGYRVVAPLDRGAGFDDVRDLAGGLAARLAAAAPDTVTTEQRINKRGDRIYLDVNRNAYGQTAIAPYSTRARDTGPVAVPIELGELSRVAPDGFDMRGVRRRLARKDDPWHDLHRSPGNAPAARSRLERLEGGHRDS